MCLPALWESTCDTGKNGPREIIRTLASKRPNSAGGHIGPHPTSTWVGSVALGLNEYRRTSRTVAHGEPVLNSVGVKLLACQQ